MIERSVFILLFAIGSFAPTSESYAQQSTQAPLYNHVPDLSKAILDDAQATREIADRHVRDQDFYQAAKDYENLLGRWQDIPDVLTTYPVLMALGGAHLEAATNRVRDAGRPPNPPKWRDLPEPKRDAINSHLERVYDAVGRAAKLANAIGLDSAHRAEFKCVASEKMATARSFQGVVNSNLTYLDQGIQGYQDSAACSPNSGKTVQYLTGVRRNISGSILGSDFIAETASSFIKVAAPGGSWISGAIDIGYKFYNDRRPGPGEMLKTR